MVGPGRLFRPANSRVMMFTRGLVSSRVVCGNELLLHQNARLLGRFDTSLYPTSHCSLAVLLRRGCLKPRVVGFWLRV